MADCEAPGELPPSCMQSEDPNNAVGQRTLVGDGECFKPMVRALKTLAAEFGDFGSHVEELFTINDNLSELNNSLIDILDGLELTSSCAFPNVRVSMRQTSTKPLASIVPKSGSDRMSLGGRGSVGEKGSKSGGEKMKKKKPRGRKKSEGSKKNSKKILSIRDTADKLPRKYQTEYHLERLDFILYRLKEKNQSLLLSEVVQETGFSAMHSKEYLHALMKFGYVVREKEKAFSYRLADSLKKLRCPR